MATTTLATSRRRCDRATSRGAVIRRASRRAVAVAIPTVTLLLAACTGSSGVGTGASGSSGAPSSGAAATSVPSVGTTTRSTLGRYSKVLVIAEENKTYDEILGSDSDAPYLKQLAAGYGSATAMDAGYPVPCPSLAAYLLMTSGDRYGICDDDPPEAHPISAANIFEQVAASGRQWRDYAESTPTPCSRTDSDDGLYLVHHVPAAYYLDLASSCQSWDIEMGTPAHGLLHRDIAAGSLPAYGFISPNVCDDMHGGPNCPGDIGTGDTWLRRWIPEIMAGADYRRGDLVIVITWDEGSDTDNHIPTLVISPTTRHVAVALPLTHCSMLRTEEDVLRLAPLGCAAGAASAVTAFHLSTG